MLQTLDNIETVAKEVVGNVIYYKWKDEDWKLLKHSNPNYINYELELYTRMYHPEYTFKAVWEDEKIIRASI